MATIRTMLADLSVAAGLGLALLGVYFHEWRTKAPEIAAKDSLELDNLLQPVRKTNQPAEPTVATSPLPVESKPQTPSVALAAPPKPDPQAVAGKAAQVSTPSQANKPATPKSPPVQIADPGLAVYQLRTLDDRPKTLLQYGGTPESEQAVLAGLDWLARHQSVQGGWSCVCLTPNPLGCCDSRFPCTMPGSPHDAAHTGMALLAFQAGGHYAFNNAKYSKNVQRGLKWLVQRQGPDGAFAPSSPLLNFGFGTYYMYEHGIATFAIAEACALARANQRNPDPLQLEALRRAVRFIESQQHADGGWRYTPDKQTSGDTSITGWQMLALRTARSAGVAVNPQCLKAMEDFFRKNELADGRTAYYSQLVESEATTGVGMLAQQLLAEKPRSDRVRQGAEYLAKYAERTLITTLRTNPDYYLLYNCTLAMYLAGGEPWQRWNKIVRDAVIGQQIRAGCERGSWAPLDRWGSEGGRIYSTALAVLTLEVYYRYAPAEKK